MAKSKKEDNMENKTSHNAYTAAAAIVAAGLALGSFFPAITIISPKHKTTQCL